MKQAVVYVTEIPKEEVKKRPAHMVGEELLKMGLKKEYGKSLRFEPREKGEHGKPFFTLLPEIHYNITHSGKYVACVFADQPVGIDIQEHREVSFDKILSRMVREEEKEKILASENMTEEFFRAWVLREAFIKWTGEGLSRDLRTISMSEGWHSFLPVSEGYSGAIFLGEPHEIRWEQVEVSLFG